MANVQTMQIQAKYVNEIKAGKKYGSIKDSTDNVWWTNMPGLVGGPNAIKPGQVIEISYTLQKWGKGADAREVHVIEEVLDAAPRTQGTQAPEPLPQITDRDTRIFVCGYLQSVFHGTGQFPGGPELQEMIYATRCAYETAFGRAVTILKPRTAGPLPVPPRAPTPTPQPYRPPQEQIDAQDRWEEQNPL